MSGWKTKLPISFDSLTPCRCAYSLHSHWRSLLNQRTLKYELTNTNTLSWLKTTSRLNCTSTILIIYITSRYPCFARVNDIGKLRQSSGTLVLVGYVLMELLFNFYILEILISKMFYCHCQQCISLHWASNPQEKLCKLSVSDLISSYSPEPNRSIVKAWSPSPVWACRCLSRPEKDSTF